MTMYSVTNPATGEVVRSYDTATEQQIRDAVTAADDAFAVWRGRDSDERPGDRPPCR
ncbi:aldehyde dehydrogenase family protein [Janibacter limosus]|uniref:aldehyde dehydrogenase family protein n=1 Tax=Janibacter limosus TaxID=53458 RepID=UPI0035DC0348